MKFSSFSTCLEAVKAGMAYCVRKNLSPENIKALPQGEEWAVLVPAKGCMMVLL